MASSVSVPNPKLGESFLSDLPSMLVPHTASTNTKSQAPPSPRSNGGEYEYVDGSDPVRDIQSDLYLLDQAMQNAPPPRAESILQPSTLPAPILDEESPELLFGGSAFQQPLFSEASQILCLEPVAGQTSSLAPFISTVASTRPTTVPILGLPSIPPKADTGNGEHADLNSVLHELSYIIPQPDRDISFAKDHGLRSFATESVTAARYPTFPYSTVASSEIHVPAPSTFGRQKKRLISDTGLLYSEESTMRAKRAKSSLIQTEAYHPVEAREEFIQYGSAIEEDVGVRRCPVRSYSHLETALDENLAAETRPMPELYDSLSPELQRLIDNLREKISKMPRRKLRDSLAKGVSIEEVEPLMSINRDDLAEMLGLGVTTWKIFIHNTFGIPRWPARVIKSQETREKSVRGRLHDAELRNDAAAAAELWQELKKLEEKKRKGRNKILSIARSCREKLMAALGKSSSSK